MEALLSRNYANGTIPLARPLAPGMSRINVYDPTFSDLAGVLTGVKPVTYTDCSPEKVPQLKELCEKTGLKWLLAEKFLEREIPHLRPGKRVFLIGRDIKTLRAAARAWKDPKNNERWAGMLGYPECCIRLFSKWLETMGRGPDLVEMAFYKTGKKEKLDFRLNNVCNYSSRIHHDIPVDWRNYGKYTRLNREYIFHAMHVIGWHPCSYDCRESLKKGAVIFSFMKHYAPDYAAALAAALAKPVLFWDKFRYAFIDGRLAGGRIVSPAVSWPRSLLDAKSYRSVALSEEITAGNGKTGFFRDGRPLFISSLSPLVLNFVYKK